MPKVESETNQLYRKKYFINSNKILSGVHTLPEQQFLTQSCVIDASRVVLSNRSVPIRYGTTREVDRIRVDVVKDGPRIQGIRISCPCGKHAELDVEYSPAKIQSTES